MTGGAVAAATPLTVGSLFSGIGGLELGLEMTGGFTTRWQCEVEPFCREVLARHWPGLPILGDIRAVDWAAVEPVDLVCGGFPCQDISVAGKGEGIVEGNRSGLWFEFARCIRALRPRYVVVENVAALLARGLGIVLGDLAALGYDAEWDCVPAAAVGAPHRRDRLFVVGYASIDGRGEGRPEHAARQRRPAIAGPGSDSGALGDADRQRSDGRATEQQDGRGEPAPASRATVADGRDASPEGLQRGGQHGQQPQDSRDHQAELAHAQPAALHERRKSDVQRRRERDAEQAGLGGRGFTRVFRRAARSDFWDGCDYVAGRPVKPGVRLLAHGVPRRVAQLRALGNAVVPQVGQHIGRCILAFTGHGSTPEGTQPQECGCRVVLAPATPVGARAEQCSAPTENEGDSKCNL